MQQWNLNGLDRYFTAHDYAGLNFVIHVVLDVDRPLDGAALARAIESVLADVPLARSTIVEGALRARRVVAAPGRFGAADVLELHEQRLSAEAELELLDRPIAIRATPPWRVTQYPFTGGHRLALTVHHSMCDGTAATVFLNALIGRYNDFVAGRAPAPLALAREPFRFRQLLQRARDRRWTWRMLVRHARPTEQFGVQNASLLEDDHAPPGRIRYLPVPLGRARWDALAQVARGLGCTRNDLLVSAALRAADQGRRALGKPDRDFRVLLPTNLRPALGADERSLQNCIADVRASFRPDEVRGAELVGLVSQRVKLGRDLEAAVETPVNIGLAANLMPPRTFRRVLKKLDADPASFFFSFLFTHVRVPGGPVLPTGVGVRSYWMATTVPPHPGFGYFVANTGEDVTITLQYQERGLSDTRARAYRDGFLSQLDALLAPAGAERSA
jgi:NRPS condensation-like uncharacterized protein